MEWIWWADAASTAIVISSRRGFIPVPAWPPVWLPLGASRGEVTASAALLISEAVPGPGSGTSVLAVLRTAYDVEHRPVIMRSLGGTAGRMDVVRGNGGLRSEFGVGGPVLGAATLGRRIPWVFAVAVVVSLPLQLLSQFVNRRAPALFSNPDRFLLLMDEAAAGHIGRVSEELHADTVALLIRLLVENAVQVAVSAVTVVAAAHVCAHRAASLRATLARVRAVARPLGLLGLLAVAVPLLPIGLGTGIALAGEGSLPLVLAGLLIMMAGGLVGIAMVVLVYAAVAAVVIERIGPLAAMRRMYRLALRKTLSVLVTVLVALIVVRVSHALMDGLFGPRVLGRTGAAPDWIQEGLRRGCSEAIAMPLAALMYLLRYLDIRRRTESYGRAALDQELTATELTHRAEPAADDDTSP